MRKIIYTLVLLCFVFTKLFAQTKTITGKVIDENGNPISNASIIIKGTKKGTTTSSNGTYSLAVPSSVKALVVSSLNSTTQEVEIISSTMDIILKNKSAKALEEVVVTSMGIVRDKRSLGYSAQSLGASQIADRGEVNLISALQGKVAGLNITNASGGAGASVNINIRGISSFTGNNQPLFVIDGVPVSNAVDRTNGGPNGSLGDNQPANRGLDIDINTVESVNILKGPTASALYGLRASAGVILITTKKGGSVNGKSQITLNSSYSVQNAYGLPKVQNTYGEGLSGIFNQNSTSSWGPKFGSTPTITNGLIVSGSGVPYQPYANNINEFFKQGTTMDNSVSINGGDANRNQTFTIGNVTQKGILYNTDLKKTTVKFGANSTIGEKLKLGGSIQYTNTVQNGILGGNNSALSLVLGFPRSVDLTSYRKNGSYKSITGTNNFIIPGFDNPYFDAFQDPLKSNLNRFNGNFSLSYDLFKWLNISYRLGGDIYTDKRKQVFEISSVRVPNGQVREEVFNRSEINGDLILRANAKNVFVHDLDVSGILGQNINQKTFQDLAVQSDQLAAPGFYNVGYGSVFTVGSAETSVLQRLLGYYAQSSFNYKNYAFFEMTGRVDRSSTLPKSKNTYFYPSANASLIFTDAFNIKSDILSYGKIRAGFAKVGRDATPYLLDNYYQVTGFGNNVAGFGFPFGSIGGYRTSSNLADTLSLSPEFKSSYEAGLNLSFFKNRVSVDVTYYQDYSKSQILSLTIAPSSGYRTYTTNIGELTNKGLEAIINAEVFHSRNFSWDMIVNFTQQKNKVVAIAPGVDNSQIPGSDWGAGLPSLTPGSAFTGSIPSFKVGYGYGVIIGGTIPRSPNGERLINPATGLYQPLVAGQVLSNPNPDYQLGITNSLKYKQLNLNFTFDFIKGGQVLSFTAATYKARGVLEITGQDREKPRVLPGVIQVGDKFIPNNIQVSAQSYWQTMGGLQSEFNVYDATVLRLRDLSLGYSVPTKALNHLKLNGLRFSVFARNIFYWAPNSPIDPQLNTQGAGNIRGLDLQGTPNSRTIGADLKITL